MAINLSTIPQFITIPELITRLKAMVKERAAEDDDYAEAVRFAVEEASDISAYAYCDGEVEFDGTGCGVTMPCCGIEKFELYGPIGCADCWELIPAEVRCGKIITAMPTLMTGKLLIYGSNAYTDPAYTAANTSYDSVNDEWTLYLEGQPDIPVFGFAKICDDIYFYYCKSGTTFTQPNGIYPQDWMYTDEDCEGPLPEESHGDPDFSEVGGWVPTGTHSALTLRKNIVCGKTDEVDMASILPGTEVVFPLAFHSSAHMNMVLYGAAENLYFRLVSSCSTARDIDRYTAMNKYYADRRERAIMQMPKIYRGKIRSRHANDFRSNGALSYRHRNRYYSGLYPCVGCG